MSKREIPFGDLSLNLFSVNCEEWKCQQPRQGPFLWPWNPWDWRKLSQVKVTCFLTRQVFSANFQPNAFCLRLILRNSSIISPVTLFSSPLCQKKLDSGSNKNNNNNLCSLFQGDATVTSNKLAVSKRDLVPPTCEPALLLWKQLPSSEFHAVFKGEKGSTSK